MIPKFRAWDKETKTMIDVSLINFEEHSILGGYWEFGQTESIKFDEVELMQSTGLKDKNGKEIFEGDIVRQVRTQTTTENKTITGGLTMLEGAWVIMNDCEQLASYLWSETDENEIIGNVCENEELLEVKE